jgi:hypothetical protein
VSRVGAWGQELGAYAALPFGVTLAAYSNLIDRQVWPAGTHTILLALGAGSIVSALQIRRLLPGDRVRPPRALRVLAAVAPLAIGATAILAWGPTVATKLADVALHDRQLAGVTIALPEGDEPGGPLRSSDTTISRVAGLDLSASAFWQIGTFNDQAAQRIAEAGARNAEAGAPEPLPDAALPVGNGIRHRSFRIAKGDIQMFLTVFACAPRIFGVMTAGAGARVLSQRTLTSVRCRSEGERPRSFAAVVGLPADWTRVPSDPGEVAYSKGDEEFGVSAIDLVTDDQLQRMMEAAAQQLGGAAQLGVRRDVATPAGTRAVWSGTLSSGSATVPLMLSAWRCTDERLTLIARHIGGRDDASSLELLGYVRCAAVGDRP